MSCRTRWKEIGEHLSQTISNFDTKGKVIYTELLDSFERLCYLDKLKVKSSRVGAEFDHGGPTSQRLCKLKNEDDQDYCSGMIAG